MLFDEVCSLLLLGNVKRQTHFCNVFLVAAVLVTVCVAAACSSSTRRPNIILIMADDLGYETLGVNGSTSYETSTLDALAEEGMRFTQAYATPLCTPTRVQLMTGKYNFRNYIGFGLLDPLERTFAHYLQEAGYRTAVMGKWQLYGNSAQRELFGRTGSLPHQAGFDEYVLWQVEERAGPRFKDPYLDVLDEPSRVYPGAYGPDVFVTAIEDFMARHRDQPFFVYYPMVLTHDPFQPTPDHPDYADFDPASGVNNPVYFQDNVAYMDKIVGRIVRRLDELGLRENTLLLFTGDNGTDRKVTSDVGTRRVRGNKGYPTAAGTHVPLIANWPGTIMPGQVNDNLIDFTDFLPSLVDAAGVSIPDSVTTDGLSFYAQLLGRADTVRTWVFCHYAPRWGNFEHRRYAHDRDWKLYEDGAFYHIAVDPEEVWPLEDDPVPAEAREARQRLLTVLERLR